MATIKRIGQFWNNGGGTPDWADTGVNQQRAYVPNLSDDTGQYWWYRIGGRVGRNTAGSKRLRFYVTNTTTGQGSGGANSRVPNAVLKHTAEISTSALFTGSNEGEWRWANFDEPFLGNINSGYALGIASRDNGTSIGMIQAANPAMSDADNTWFYDRATNGSGIPQGGYSSTVNAGHQAVAMEGVKNEPPNRPGAITIESGGSTQTPTFRASFSDPNETVNGVATDRLETYRMEVWWGGTRQHNGTYTASGTERSGRYSQRQSPVSIPWDTPYTVFFFHRDRAGAESVGRSFSGTIFSGATVDTPTSPIGFITTPANPGGITAIYRSTGSVNANAVRVRLVNSAGNPVQTSGILTRTVAPNASTTVTWAQSGFGTQPSGVTRGVQMQARDTNGNWSPWSGTVWFRTNTAPDIPVITGPANGAASSSLPGLYVTVNDVDGGNGNKNSGLQVFCEILDDNDAVLGTINAVWQEWLLGKWWVSPIALNASGLIPGHGLYKHRWYVYDGHLYSGGSTTVGGATRSASRTFVYANVPSVTITDPSSPISTTQPTITWSSSDQTHWRVRGYAGATVVYDTGEQAGSVLSHQISGSMYWQAGERWNNGEEFTWIVSVRDSTTLWGESAPLALTLEYDPLETLIIDGAAMALPGIAGTHYNQVITSVSTYDEADFKGYHRRRVNITGPMGDEIPGTEVRLPTEQSAGNTVFNDYHVISNQWYRYYLWQEIEVGNDIVPSDAVSIDLMSSWHGIVLFSNADPLGSAVWLRYGGPGGSFEPTVSETIVRRNVSVRGRRSPIAVVNGQRELTANGEHAFITNEGMSAIEQLERLYTIADYQYMHTSPNGRPNSVCYRAGRGASRSLAYMTMNIDANPHHRIEVVSLDFEETNFDPYAEVS